MDVAPCYSYSHSKGLFAGISLEGSVILARPDINRSFYGKAVSVADLLGGVESPPVAAAPLYDAIRGATERFVTVQITHSVQSRDVGCTLLTTCAVILIAVQQMQVPASCSAHQF